MKYRYILDLLSCWRKANGYTEWAFRLTSTETGKQITGRIPHSSNLTTSLSNFLGSMDSVYYTTHILPLKDFRCATAEMTGCDIEKILRTFLGKDEKPEPPISEGVDWVRWYKKKNDCGLHEAFQALQKKRAISPGGARHGLNW